MESLKRATIFLLLSCTGFHLDAWETGSVTAVRDVVYTPDGQAFTGFVQIAPEEHFGATHLPTITVPVEDGLLSLRLAATVPDKPPYVVTYRGSNGSTWTEIWLVPSKTHASLNDVRFPQINASESKDITLPIPINDVAGLSAALSNLNSSLGSLAANVNSLTSAVQNSTATMTIRGETPAGALDGSNVTFTLANTPSPSSSLALYKNGNRQTLGTDFLLSGKVIQFVAAAAPKTGDTVSADYLASGIGTKGTPRLNVRAITLPIPISGVSGLPAALSQINNSLTSISSTVSSLTTQVQSLNSSVVIYGQTPLGAIDGANTLFTLASVPSGNTIALFKNGLREAAGVDYSLSGSTITFYNSALPQPGDVLVADYETQSAQ